MNVLRYSSTKTSIQRGNCFQILSLNIHFQLYGYCCLFCLLFVYFLVFVAVVCFVFVVCFFVVFLKELSDFKCEYHFSSIYSNITVKLFPKSQSI